MSLRAAAHSRSVFTSMQSSALAPRRRTRLLPMNIHGRQLARLCAADDACERALLVRSPPTSAHSMPEWIDRISPRAFGIPSLLEYSSMPER